MIETIDLGEVNSIIAKSDPQDEELLRLVVSDEEGTIETIRAKREALLGLWTHLTAILYPRAAGQLAQRRDTAKRDNAEGPTDVAHKADAFVNERDSQFIVIACESQEICWTAQMTHENADDLWSSLEDKLDQV